MTQPAAEQPAAASAVTRMRAVLAHISRESLPSASQEAADAAASWSSSGAGVPLSTDTRWDGWGYVDTKLFINSDGVVELTGSRYAEVFHSAQHRTLPLLLPWAMKTLGIDPTKRSPASNLNVDALNVVDPPVAQDPALQQRLRAFLASLEQELQLRTSTTLAERVRHGHGQTCEEIFRLRHLSEIERIPDAVVWPTSHAQVERLVQEAVTHSAHICLIPHGGGTNVSNALVCCPSERRAIVSIDMRAMNRILSVDKENMVVRVEAGITGLELHERLRNKGLTLGHEPDSWEFSTLGGWVATRASGMKKNVYGNIEDLVVNLRTVTAQGTMERAATVPRVSMGPDTTQLVLGSEGILGVVTEVTLRVRSFPTAQIYDSLLFPTFAHGLAAMHDVLRSQCVPASIRLLDNTQFQLGQALKVASDQFGAGVLDYAKKAYVTKVRGFDVSAMCAATVLLEGSAEDVARQQAQVQAIARKHHGLVGGAESGKRGYFFTYIIAYLRDFAMDYYFMSESFETAVPWTNVQQLCADVKAAISATAARHRVRIQPLIACRVTQLYETGVAVYVYYGVYYYGVENAVSLFREIERVAVDAIVANGGSLSHHHGVGKHRRKWLPAAISAPGISAIQGLKSALDPRNIFAAGNVLPPSLQDLKMATQGALHHAPAAPDNELNDYEDDDDDYDDDNDLTDDESRDCDSTELEDELMRAAFADLMTSN
ncbi:hypothetical protein PybrP1_010485, partial [[Pythium] brassicae (nom. inval.)]